MRQTCTRSNMFKGTPERNCSFAVFIGAWGRVCGYLSQTEQRMGGERGTRGTENKWTQKFWKEEQKEGNDLEDVVLDL